MRLATPVLLAILLALPAAAHVGQTASRAAPAAQHVGHFTDTPSYDPLAQFKWIGPPGTHIEDKPCQPAIKQMGIGAPYPIEEITKEGRNPDPSKVDINRATKVGGPSYFVEALATTHIGHITHVRGMSPSSASLVPGSGNFFHVSHMYADVPGLEGGSSTSGFMLGADGFARYRFSESVYDADEQFDIRFGDVHPYASYCVYGAIDENGPWLFIGSAFKYENISTSETFVDLEYFYRDMWEIAGYPGEPRVDYLMLVGSLDKFPKLIVDFEFSPASPFGPGTQVQFTDKSKVYGWVGKDVYDGWTTTDQMQDNNPDELDRHEWWFDTDRTAARSFTIGSTPPDYVGFWPSSQHPPPGLHQFYPDTGIYDVCERVTTRNLLTGVACKTLEVKDPPPEAAFSIQGVGCYFPSVTFFDRTRLAGTDTLEVIQWDFGDGKTGRGSPVEHTYEESGVYNVTLFVMDDDGQTDQTNMFIFAIGAKQCGIPPSRSNDGSNPHAAPSDGVSADASLDSDKDGVPDQFDSCPHDPNADEVFNLRDLDGDGVNDTCDLDRDGDGFHNDLDLCPELFETSMADLDRDGLGDGCDPDPDGDGVPTLKSGKPVDVCPMVPDADQRDLDQDGVGDACDDDRDGDGVPNALDRFPDDIGEWADRNLNLKGDNRDLREAEAREAASRLASSVEVASRDASAVGVLLLLAALGALVVLRPRRE